MKRLAYILSLSLCVVGPAWATDPPLASYAVDIHQTSVSGVSSGGAMALQVHVAHSSIMRGAGIIAGVAYDCADPNLPLVAQRVGLVVTCMDGSFDYAAASIARTDAATAIDATSNLRSQKVWLFSGYNDGIVRRGAMDTVARYYDHYVNPENVFYKTNNHAPHGLISNDGAPCLASNPEWLNNCNYDAAGFVLQHIYGYLKPPKNPLSSSPQAFDQHDFVSGDPKAIGLADTGYVYVPTACQTQTCRVHIVFHGCKQYAQKVTDAVYGRGGYNRWADTNNIIVLYPQTAPVGTEDSGNFGGCWNWWGFTGDGEHDFAQKTGQQISAIKKMVDRLAAGPPRPGGPPDAFGPPKNFRVSDSTPTSLAMIWQTSNAATGFNIYRSRTKSGSYTKINSTPVSGPSFVDRGLTPKATYYYKITAVDGSNHESAPTGPAHKKTASNPKACNPYFSNNRVHVQMARALPGLDGKGQVVARAAGSGEILGPIDENHFSQLTRAGALPIYHVRYCS